MKLAASSDFRLQSRDIQQCKLRLSPFEQHGVAFSLVVTEGDILTVDVPVASSSFLIKVLLGIVLLPKTGMDPRCRQAWQGLDCLFRTAGTSRRTSAGLSAEVHLPVASSWCVQNTFRPAKFCAPNPRMGGAFPNASPQNISCSVPPARKVAAGRLPPARPFPLGADPC